MTKVRLINRSAELVLLAASLVLSFLGAEMASRYMLLSDKVAGWSSVPPVADRAASTRAAQPGHIRIVALGDSVTEWRDSVGDSFVRVAQRLLPNIEVVNLAEGGTGLPEYFGNLLRYGSPLRPDVVLIGLYLGNDLYPCSPPLDSPQAADAALGLRSQQRTAGEALKRIAKRSVFLNYVFRFSKIYIRPLRSGFLERSIEALQMQTGRDDTFVASRLRQIDPELLEAARADSINVWDVATAIFYPDYYGDLAAATPGTDKGEEVMGALRDLRALITEARRTRAKVAVLLLPPPVWVGETYRQYFRRLGYRELGPTVGPVPLIERLKTFASAEGVPALDVLPALRAEREKAFLENDVHPNRRGHEVIGAELASFLVRERLASTNTR
jgi:lysophospholipase L1-like esterase